MMEGQLGLSGIVTFKLDVRDLDVSVRWYGEKLGFEVIPESVADGWAELSTGIANVTIGLYANPFSFQVNGGGVPNFWVHDVEAARERLAARGVPVGAITLGGHGRRAFRFALFPDPDGNHLAIRERVTIDVRRGPID